VKPLRVPGDGAKPAKNYLAAVVPALADESALTFSVNLPSEWAPTSAPHVSVFDDNGPVIPFVGTKTRLRVTVWADGRDRARRIAGVCMAVLMAHRIDGVGAVSDPTGLADSRDSTNGGLMCSFTVAAIVRTAAL
jgi:hypothetical protein